MKLPHDVTVVTAGYATDRYTNRTKVWTVPPATEVALTGFFQPRKGSEDETGGDAQVGDGVLYLPGAAPVSGENRVTVLGLTYEVVGPPEVHVSGSPLDHTKVVLRRTSD